MSILSVYHVSSPDLPNKVLTHVEDIASTLAEHGVVFDRRPAGTPIIPGAGEEEVTGAYRAQIDEWMTERGYTTFEVLSLHSQYPQKAELRARLVDEQQHDEDHVRFFVAGRGLLSLHIGEFVYAVLCEKHDWISLPAGTRHWFDMGEHPQLVTINLSNNPRGEFARLTGEPIASQFPRLDDF